MRKINNKGFADPIIVPLIAVAAIIILAIIGVVIAC